MSLLHWKRALRRMHQAAQHVAVDEVWLKQDRARLLTHLAKTLPVEHVSTPSVAHSFFAQFVSTRFAAFLRRPALAMLSIFGVIAGGSVASVSAAERAVPGDFLYPLKIVREQANLVLAKTKTEKLKLKTEYVGRRIEEVKTLATSNQPEKGERIKETAEVLKRDFDTVKNQLSEVKQEAPSRDIAVTAKLIDQQTNEVVKTLKDVKSGLSTEAQTTVVEAQAAAVDTSVKAVQALIDVSEDPDIKDVVTGDEIAKVVQDKVDGFEQNISDAAQKLVATGIATATSTGIKMSSSSLPFLTTSTRLVIGTSTLLTVSSTDVTSSVLPVAASTSIETINSAKQRLDETKQLISEQKLQEVKDKLGEVAHAAAQVETSIAVIESVVAANTSSSAVLSAPATSTSMGGSMNPASSTTSTLPASSATTTMSSSSVTSSSTAILGSSSTTPSSTSSTSVLAPTSTSKIP